MKTIATIAALLIASMMFAAEKPNVLFIVVDDLRPELNCYGESQIKSPHIDKLAESGITFTNAYCNIPVCGASRASFMSGVRPRPGIFLNFLSKADKDVPEAVALSQHFKNNGYTTISNGKVFHHMDDSDESWDENWRSDKKLWVLDESLTTLSEKGKGPVMECADVPDSAYIDGETALKTIHDLKQLKEEGKPFFLGCGFLRPHLPFVAPKKYWDMYTREEAKPATNNYPPENCPRPALHNNGEFKQYSGIDHKNISDSMAYDLVHGYYASVSYTDAQVGKVLNTLDELGLAENTIVVLFGDHGWNLREHTLWAKHCNFNTSLRAPIIVRDPRIKGGFKTKSIAEFVDIYPTLCDLTGLEKPSHLAGRSFAPSVQDPEFITDTIAVSKFKNGVTLITPRYFYTEWINNKNQQYARMLYDHQTDPEENYNIADKEENKELVEFLHKELIKHRGY